MTTTGSLVDVVSDGIPFVVVLAFWIVVTAIVYGAFALVWPDVPGAEPWIFLGVYLLPVIGFLGHTLQQALKHGRGP